MTKTDIANGEGVRCVLWVAGCDIQCEGCHNPETWDFCAGQPFCNDDMDELVHALKRTWIKGLTLSGGHPLAHNNLPKVYEICKTVKEKCPDKDIWLYTGYTLDVSDFIATEDNEGLLRNHVLAMCDVVVDGQFVKDLRDISLRFRGSSNQRIIDVKQTILNKEICLWEDE